MRRIKVLHLITHMGFGGALDNTLLTVRGLSRSRYEVHLASGQDYTDWEDRGRRWSDDFFVIPDLHRSVSPAADIQALNHISSLIRKERYDIVHTHCAKAGVLGRMAAHRAAAPVVVHTFHLFGWQDARTPNGHLWQNCAAWLRSRLFFEAERYAASLSDALITVCELNRRQAVDLGLAPAEKFTTIHSGIDLSQFAVNGDRHVKRRAVGLDPSIPVVGMIGRLSPQKAPLDFVHAAKIVLQRKADVQFVMAGDGPLAAEVSAAIGDENRIRMLGFRDDVAEILSMLDVFALSSLWEGLGRAVTEAMIMSVPVAATAVDGVPELVRNRETGLLSPAGDPTGLANNILWLLEHPECARSMARRAHEHVVPAFAADVMVDRIESLYDELLHRKACSCVAS